MLKKLRQSSTKSPSIQQPQDAQTEKLLLDSAEETSVDLENEEDNLETSPRRRQMLIPENPGGHRILRLGPEYPTLVEQQVFIQEMLDFNSIYTPKKNDLFSIQHNFTLLIRLMQAEKDRPENERRFLELIADDNTGNDNKRYDFSLKVHDQLFSAYVYRYQKKIIYGLMPDGLEDPIIYHQTVPALVNLAKFDVETLTQQIQKSPPPFEVITTFKDEALATFLRHQFQLS